MSTELKSKGGTVVAYQLGISSLLGITREDQTYLLKGSNHSVGVTNMITCT